MAITTQAEQASGILNTIVQDYILFWQDWPAFSKQLLVVIIFLSVLMWFAFKKEFEELNSKSNIGWFFATCSKKIKSDTTKTTKTTKKTKTTNTTFLSVQSLHCHYISIYAVWVVSVVSVVLVDIVPTLVSTMSLQQKNIYSSSSQENKGDKMRLVKNGNSKAVIIPKFILSSLRWNDEDDLLLEIKGNGIYIEKEDKTIE